MKYFLSGGGLTADELNEFLGGRSVAPGQVLSVRRSCAAPREFFQLASEPDWFGSPDESGRVTSWRSRLEFVWSGSVRAEHCRFIFGNEVAPIGQQDPPEGETVELCRYEGYVVREPHAERGGYFIAESASLKYEIFNPTVVGWPDLPLSDDYYYSLDTYGRTSVLSRGSWRVDMFPGRGRVTEVTAQRIMSGGRFPAWTVVPVMPGPVKTTMLDYFAGWYGNDGEVPERLLLRARMDKFGYMSFDFLAR